LARIVTLLRARGEDIYKAPFSSLKIRPYPFVFLCADAFDLAQIVGTLEGSRFDDPSGQNLSDAGYPLQRFSTGVVNCELRVYAWKLSPGCRRYVG
jgi:hypothetical protein